MESVLGDIQHSTGHSLWQPVLAYPALSRGFGLGDLQGPFPPQLFYSFMTMNYFIPVTLVISESEQAAYWIARDDRKHRIYKQQVRVFWKPMGIFCVLERVELFYGEPIQRIIWLFSFWNPEMPWKFSWQDGFWVPVNSTILEFLTHIQEFSLCSQLCFWTAASFWMYPFPSLYFVYCFIKWWT